MHIRKAVLPVAGLGTRVLPASKVVPKELLPVVDKPTLQYIVEEAVEAGIEEIIFVTSRHKHSLEDHFDSFPELERLLEHKGKHKELRELHRIQKLARYASVRQDVPRGLGHAIHCAKKLVGNEPFVVMLGDEIYPTEPCLPQLIATYEKYQTSVLTLFRVPREQIPSYGIASVEKLENAVFQVNNLVEKPPIQEAPSDLAVAGRYVMTPDIFTILEKTPPGRGGEIQVTDALQIQAQEGRCHGIHFEGERYDTGSPLGLLITSVAIGLKHPEISAPLREALQELLKAE